MKTFLVRQFFFNRNLFFSSKICFRSKFFLDRNFYLKSFQKEIISKKKKKRWSFVKKLFNDQHSENEIINLSGKRYDINERDDVFRWFCSNKVGDYCIFLRICELASNCCDKKHEKGFDIGLGFRF